MKKNKRSHMWQGEVVVRVRTEDDELHEVLVDFSGYFKDALWEGPPDNWEEWAGDYDYKIEGKHSDEVLDLVEAKIKDDWQTWVLTKGGHLNAK